MPSNASEITVLLQEWSTGDSKALEALLPLVMNDLRRAAAFYFQREDLDHILQPTALVNDVCLRLMGWRKVQFENRLQFFSFAGKLMRLLLIDYARSKNAKIHGGDIEMVSLTTAINYTQRQPVDPDTLLDLDRALSRLEEDDPQVAEVVDLRYFAGMTEQETAKALGINISTVKRRWNVAKRRLALELGNPLEEDEEDDEEK
ncbi:MAG TPA: ECF-type sigma factor [Thermoanaerobaculia bacterium]|nr:ECF-type sigma factor [Thermoanaerobaculia bacterium]